MIRTGRPGELFRPSAYGKNSHGDPVDADGKIVRPTDLGIKVGDIKGILIGGLSASPSMSRQESSNTTGQLGIPNRQPLKVGFGDRLKIDGVTYKVTSPRRWDYPQSMSGTQPVYHWVSVEGTI